MTSKYGHSFKREYKSSVFSGVATTARESMNEQALLIVIIPNEAFDSADAVRDRGSAGQQRRLDTGSDGAFPIAAQSRCGDLCLRCAGKSSVCGQQRRWPRTVPRGAADPEFSGPGRLLVDRSAS